MLSWASRFNICCFLDNHSYQLPSHSLECILAAGAVRSVQASAGNAFDQLKDFTAGERDWLFGHFGYGLAKETEPVDPTPAFGHPEAASAANVIPHSGSLPHPDQIGFPDLFFFVPEILIELTANTIRIGSLQDDHRTILERISHTAVSSSTPSDVLLNPVPGRPFSSDLSSSDLSSSDLFSSDLPSSDFHSSDSRPPDGTSSPSPVLLPRFSKEEYLETVRALQRHILRGDCYEINLCQEFFAHPVHIDPLHTWLSLSQASPNPFAAFYKVDDSYLLCASPERYLQRIGDTLLSQPIKGTSPRFQGNPARDEAARDELYNSAKDRSENVMVVDLVRNDLSKICLPGSVRVEELYGIYSFPHVHQMISTIKGELPPGTHWVEAIRATFPMGSMTGAPKKRVVELIGQYERTARGIFSGGVGYVTPEGDFDFNVVIRSILYNNRDQYLSYLVGSGITYYSDAEKEYEECLWKAEGIKKAFGYFS